jgi:hypothetical protein
LAETSVRAIEGHAEVYVAGLDTCFAVRRDATSDVEGLLITPSSNEIHAGLEFLRNRSADHVDPMADGLRALNVLRRHPVVYPNGGGGVGGFAQLTTVSRYAITTSIIHRWPDRVGEPISR